MSTTRYAALIDGKRGAYGVTFPDLPGCTAMGRTLDEAFHISLDQGLLQAIDDAAKAHGLTRSAFLIRAAREKIASGR